jgi:hypothetical protein
MIDARIVQGAERDSCEDRRGRLLGGRVARRSWRTIAWDRYLVKTQYLLIIIRMRCGFWPLLRWKGRPLLFGSAELSAESREMH